LIDGQQRIIALRAAVLGESVVNKEYRKVNITIAFNPKEQAFEVLNPAIEKDNAWLPDISKIITGEIDILGLIKEYCSNNPDIDEKLFISESNLCER